MNLRRPFDPDPIAANGAPATVGKPGFEATETVADFDDQFSPRRPRRRGRGGVTGGP